MEFVPIKTCAPRKFVIRVIQNQWGMGTISQIFRSFQGAHTTILILYCRDDGRKEKRNECHRFCGFFPDEPGIAERTDGNEGADGASENAAASAGKKVNVALAAKHQLNISILQAFVRVSISAGDQPQALLFQSAIDHINSLLALELGPNAIQDAATSQDNSAEATAGRILIRSSSGRPG
jgi:hypothetical protein